MSPFEINKIAGALLAALLTAGIAATISNVVYPEPPVPAALLGLPASPSPSGAADPPAADPIGIRLAAADPAAGERAVRKCAACHTFASGQPDRVGPNLHALIDRPVGTRPDFRYSRAMAAQEGVWTYAALDAFLADPGTYLPGTSMAFAGIRDPDVRAAILAWLRLQSETPAPLPPPG